MNLSDIDHEAEADLDNHVNHTDVDEYQIPDYTNYSFAGVYILCMAVGLPGNTIALQYFVSVARSGGSRGCNKSFFNTLYIIISLVDIVVCGTILPVVVSFMYNRDEMWFSIGLFCQAWGILWEMLPFISVFLVGLMSISRTVVLIRPLCQLKMKLLIGLNVGYCVFLVLRTVIPIWLNAATYKYVYSDVYCYELPSTDWSYKFNSISRSLTLAAPVIPICISCTTSYIIIKLNESKQQKQRKKSRAKVPLVCNESSGRILANGKPKLSKRQHKKTSPMAATMTILIFTIAYIVFNIPVFVNYLLMSIAGWSKNCTDDCYHKTYKNHPALIWYSWNFTYITCVALNSMINPLIYYWRMFQVKDFVNVRMRNTSKALLDLQSSEIRKRVSGVFSKAGYTLSTVESCDELEGIPEDCDTNSKEVCKI